MNTYLGSRRWTWRRRAVLLASLAACAAACTIDINYDRTRFRCTGTKLCPDGFKCLDGVCERPGTLPDASVGVADADLDEVDAMVDAQPEGFKRFLALEPPQISWSTAAN